MNNNKFPNKFLSIVLLSFFSIFILLIDDLSLIANVCFYFYFGIIFLNYLSTKDISLDIIWLIGFLFVILAELFITQAGEDVLIVTKYILLGNNVILIAYYCSRTKSYYLVHDYRLRNRTWYVALCLLSTLIYIIVILPEALLSWRYGRQTYGRSSLFTFVVSNFAYILPALWAYYFRKKRRGVLISFLLSFPYFALLFMQGTRFKVLFAVLSFVIGSGFLSLYNVKLRLLVIYGFLGVILMTSFSIMKNIRVLGASSIEDNTLLLGGTTDNNYSRLPAKVVSYGSNEGVINANKWLFDYCNKYGYSYGKQSSFIFYWWIPRSIWKNKPAMTGSWLPHLYGNFSETHSSSIGIWGELYVDYGYYSFLFFILFGFIIRRLDSYCKYLLTIKSNNINLIQASIIVPFVFFSVRSPITSFISLSISLIFFYFFRYLLFEKVG